MAEDVGALVIELALDNSNFQRGMENMDRTIRNATAEFRNSTSGMSNYGRGLDGLEAKSKMLTKQVEAQSKKVAMQKERFEASKKNLDDNTKAQVELREKIISTNRAYDHSVEATGKNSNESKKLKEELDKLNNKYTENEEKLRNNVRTMENAEKKVLDYDRSLNYMKKDLEETSKQIEIQSSKWTQLSQKLDSIGNKFKEIGDKGQVIGKSLTKRVTAPLMALGVAGAKAGQDINKAMATVSTMIPGQSERLHQLKKDIQDVSIDVAKHTDEIADATYGVISAYGDAADTMDKVKLNAMGATAGVATTNDALNLTSAVMKGFGDTSAEANKKVLDLSFETLKLGQTSFPDLASSIGKVVPQTNELKISQEELFAVFATGTGVTGNASEVSTQYQGALKALMAPTESMTKLIKEQGVADGKALIAKYGLIDTLELIVEHSKKSKQPLQKYIGSIQGQTLALALAGEQSDVYREKLVKLQNSTGAMETAFEEQTKGINKTGFTYEQAMAKMRVAAQNLGQSLGPLLAKGANLVDRLADRLRNLSDEQMDSIVKWGKFAGSIGPVIWGVGKLTSGTGNAIIKFAKLSEILGKAGGASKLFGSAVGAVSLPAVATTATIGALGFGAYKLNERMKEATIQVDIFSDTLDTEISEATESAVSSFLELDKETSKSLSSLFLTSTEITEETASELRSNFSSMGDEINKKLKEDKEKAIKTVQELFAESKLHNEEEKAEILEQTIKSFDDEIKAVEEHQKAIDEILKKSIENKGKMSDTERINLQAHQQQLREIGVTALSETEEESLIIIQRLRDQRGEINAEILADTVKSSLEQKEKAIEQVEEEYNERIRLAEQTRAKGGKENEDLADEIIDAARRARQDSVYEAEGMHLEVVRNAKEQAKEHVDEVNWETGEIKSDWEMLGINLSKWWSRKKEDISQGWKDTKEGATQGIKDFTTPITDGLGNIGKSISTWWAGKRKDISDGWEETRKGAKQGVDDFVTELSKLPGQAKKKIEETKTEMVNKINETIEDFKESGRNIMEGLKLGIQEKIMTPINAIKEAGNSIKTNFKNALNIHSPSRDFKEYGKNIMEGTEIGILDNAKLAVDAVKKAGKMIKQAGFEESIKRLNIDSGDDETNLLNKLAIVEVQKRKINDLEYAYNNLSKQKGKNKEASEKLTKEREKSKKELESARTELLKYERDVDKTTESIIESQKKLEKELRDKQIREIDELHGAVISALKKQYQEQYRLKEESLNKELTALNKWKDESIERINSVYDNRIKRIDEVANRQIQALEDELKALDKAEKEKSRSEITVEHETAINRLEDALKYEHDEFNRKQLQKQIEAENKSFQERQHEWRLEDERELLRNQIESIREKADEEKQIISETREHELKSIEDLYNYDKEIIEMKLQNNKDYLAEKTEDIRLQREAEKIIMEESQEEIMGLLRTYDEKYKLVGESFGEQLVKGITPHIDKVNDMIAEIKASIDSLSNLSRGGSNGSGGGGGSGKTYGKAKNLTESQVDAMEKESGGGFGFTGSETKVVNNSVTINSPRAMSPRESMRETTNTLRRMSFGV